MRKERIKTAFSNISLFVKYITGSQTLSFQPGTQQERRNKKIKVWIGLCVLVILSVIFYYYFSWNKVYKMLDPNIQDVDWLGFIASYWGAITGALITGIATVITTWLIIRRSYRIDYHRERIEFLPILQISVRQDIENQVKQDNGVKNVLLMYNIWYRDWEELPEQFAVFAVKNVGAGIAISPGISEEGEAAAYGVPKFAAICPKESVFFLDNLLPFHNGQMVFTFFDIFDNFYEQKFKYEVDENSEVRNISMAMPTLVMKTQRIRYEQ